MARHWLGTLHQPDGNRTVGQSVSLWMTLYEGQNPVTETLTRMIRSKMADGTLPLDTPRNLWKGIGSGKPCSACENVILPADVEFEPQYTDQRGVVRFRVGCHGLWEAERRRRHAS